MSGARGYRSSKNSEDSNMIDQARAEIIILQAELKDIEKDIIEVRLDQKERLTSIYKKMDEIEKDQKELIRFMHEVKGGQAWLFGLLTVSATAGALISSIIGFLSSGFIHK